MKHISILRLLAGGLIFTTASCSLDYDPVDMYSDVTEGVQKEEDKGVVFKEEQLYLEWYYFQNTAEHPSVCLHKHYQNAYLQSGTYPDTNVPACHASDHKESANGLPRQPYP